MAQNPIQFQHGMSLNEFIATFGTEAQCEAALEQARWPHGFICPECGAREHSRFLADGRLSPGERVQSPYGLLPARTLSGAPVTNLPNRAPTNRSSPGSMAVYRAIHRRCAGLDHHRQSESSHRMADLHQSNKVCCPSQPCESTLMRQAVRAPA